MLSGIQIRSLSIDVAMLPAPPIHATSMQARTGNTCRMDSGLPRCGRPPVDLWRPHPLRTVDRGGARRARSGGKTPARSGWSTPLWVPCALRPRSKRSRSRVRPSRLCQAALPSLPPMCGIAHSMPIQLPLSEQLVAPRTTASPNLRVSDVAAGPFQGVQHVNPSDNNADSEVV